MEKPGSIEYLYQRMIESGLAEKLFRFELLAFLYAAKMDKSVLEMTMGVGWAFFQESPNRIDTAKSFQQLQQIDDNKLEKGIDNQIKSIIEDRGYYVMLFFAGLLKL